MKERKQKILVVDDERGMRNIINEILTEAGYEVSLAENGAMGLTLTKSVLPDLILCDIQMPSMNGYELLNAFKLDPELGKIPFVFMTGVNVGQYDVRKGMDLGADDYLTKPFTTEDLVSAIQTRLRKKQLWQKFFDSSIEKTQTGFILLLSNELQLLVMDILENAQTLLTAEKVSLETVHKTAQMITGSGKRLSHLHENILYFAMLQLWVKDQAKIDSLRKESMASYQTVLQSIVQENIRASRRADSFTINCRDAALQISPADFGKIIDELIDNACKFSSHDSKIIISSEERQNDVCLTVKDMGRGMSNQEIEAVKSLFTDKQQTYQQESGLGLTIAKTIAELYGGSLSILSGENKGTIATISLPKVK